MKVLESVKSVTRKFINKMGSLFGALKNKLSDSKLSTLVLMQLKDKWNFSFKSNKKAALFKIISYILLFAVICAISYLLMYLAGDVLHIFATQTIPLPAMSVILLVLTIFEGLSILVGLTKALYFGKDNSVLVTYPVKSNLLFVSKMLVYLIDAIKKAFTMFVPILIAFGILYKFPAYYYFLTIIYVIIYISFLVAVCGILSVPTYFVMRTLNKHKNLKIILAGVVLAGLIAGCIFLINIIPNNINIIREYENFAIGISNFLDSFNKNMFFSTTISHMFCGVKVGFRVVPLSIYSWIVPLALIVLTTGFVVLDMVVSKPFYSKMISSSNNFNGEHNKKHVNKKTNKFLASVKYEILRIVRDEKHLVSSLIVIVVSPILMLLVSKVYNSFDTRLLGDEMIVGFVFLIIVLLVTSHNISSSYIFSKDGPSWNVNKTMPVDARIALPCRLIYNEVVSLLVIVPASIIGNRFTMLTSKETVLFIISLFLLATFHNILSASYDFMHSENKDKADIGSEIISSHETMSIAFGLIIAVLSFGLLLLYYITATPNPFTRLLIVSLVVLALEGFMFVRKIVAFYKEN